MLYGSILSQLPDFLLQVWARHRVQLLSSFGLQRHLRARAKKKKTAPDTWQLDVSEVTYADGRRWDGVTATMVRMWYGWCVAMA
jgi:hypothetical protein